MRYEERFFYSLEEHWPSRGGGGMGWWRLWHPDQRQRCGGSSSGGHEAVRLVSEPVSGPGGRRKAGSLLSGSTRRLEGIRNFSSINRKWWLQSYLNRGDFKQIQLSWDIWIWFEWNWIETKDENCPDENCNVKWHFDHKNDSWCESGHWDWPQIKNMKRLTGSLDNTCLWIGKWVLITGSI